MQIKSVVFYCWRFISPKEFKINPIHNFFSFSFYFSAVHYCLYFRKIKLDFFLFMCVDSCQTGWADRNGKSWSHFWAQEEAIRILISTIFSRNVRAFIIKEWGNRHDTVKMKCGQNIFQKLQTHSIVDWENDQRINRKSKNMTYLSYNWSHCNKYSISS